jgi:hypothetical protein
LEAFAPNIGIAWIEQRKDRDPRRNTTNYVNDEFFTAANNAAAGNTGLSTTCKTSVCPGRP